MKKDETKQIEKLRRDVEARLKDRLEVVELVMSRGPMSMSGMIQIIVTFEAQVKGELRKCEYALPVHYPFNDETPVWISAGLYDSVTF
jgi:hypothetical protein